MAKTVLAFDFGASSGRAVLGIFDGKSIELKEVHRFDNDPVQVRGTFYWDILRLFHEIKHGISMAKAETEFESIAIDTWGVDFGLLDKNGDLLQNPVHYRDTRTDGMTEKLFEKMSSDELYKKTGVQVMAINTIFQLFALAEKQPELLKRADCALLMPDLMAYLLTGIKSAEYSMASTTQLMNPHTAKWDEELFELIGAPQLFPEITMPGNVLGEVSQEISDELGINKNVKVISVAGHDTGSAVAAVPATGKDFIYISCGTWSLFGTELPEPNISEKSMTYNITNEGGYNKTSRFLKNIIGLWLIQETRRQYRREGKQYSYNDLEKYALAAQPFAYFIDPDAPEFVPPGDIPARVRAYCKRTGQGEPQTVGEIMRCIYESIALKYRLTYDLICDCTGRDYNMIHMIGGGTKDNLLCAMTANSTGCEIMAGPIEATALGNVAVQLMALGEISGLDQAREVIRNSFEPITYRSDVVQVTQWQAAFEMYKRIVTI